MNFKTVVSLAVLGLFCACCGNNRTASGSGTAQSQNDHTLKDGGSEWYYSEQLDASTRQPYYFAEIKSHGILTSGIVEDKIGPMTLTVREDRANKDAVVIHVIDDRFGIKCGNSDKAVRLVLVAFDNEPDMEWICIPYERIDDALEIQNTNEFINRLTLSQTMKITAYLIKGGTMTFEFNTAGFEWIHQSKGLLLKSAQQV